MAKTNLLIVGGRKLLREGLALLLRDIADLRVVGEAAEVDGAMKMIAPLRVRVIILNLTSSTQIGAELIQKLASVRSPPKLVALTLNPSTEALQILLDAGAAACLTKECSSEELVLAIRSAVSGQRYLSPSLLEQLVKSAAPTRLRAKRPKPLAPRERVVLRLIALGQTTKSIALQLGVSSKTIETLRRRIMEKLQRFSVAELTQYAVTEELIALENPT